LDEVLVLSRIPQLREIRRLNDGVAIGATATLSEVESAVEPSHQELARLLRVFASPQIKHLGTLVGNLVNASPIADTIPALMVLDARLCLKSSGDSRWVELNHFYQDYKKFDLRSGEIVTEVFLPHLPEGAVARFYKASMRKDLDISSVTFAGVLKVENGRVMSAKIALGGVGPVVLRLPNVEQELKGKEFSEKSFARAGELALKSVRPIDDVRASANYRRLVAKNFFKKYYVDAAMELTR
jgi:xanthine dehydrogenase small subunit